MSFQKRLDSPYRSGRISKPMHILFIHPNFPAQFGQIAAFLAQKKGFRCTFLNEVATGNVDGICRIQYQLRGGATDSTSFCSRTFENVICRSFSAYESLQAHPEIRPDLIVAHSGFLSSVFLREIYSCPIVNYFEFFYHVTNSDMDFRSEFPSSPLIRLRARARNAHLLLDLENCDLGYSPTRWQRGLFPTPFQSKLRSIFDGIDTRFWHPLPGVPRRIGHFDFPDGVKVVSYVSRGFESIRGFDIFMKAAKRLYESRSDVVFVVVGEDRICYGGDENAIGMSSFKQWVLTQDSYDLSRFIFTGRLDPVELAQLFSFCDLHIYLTGPFVLSWSLMNAMACGTTVIASDTAPVQEVIVDGQNGILVDFFDDEHLAEIANEVLDDPVAYRRLGEAAIRMIHEHYSLDVCIPKILQIYEDALHNRRD